MQESRLPLSVHRLPPVISQDKQSTHTRFTVNGYTVSGEMGVQIASSQQPEGRSNLAPEKEKSSKPQAFSSLFKPFQAFNIYVSPIVSCFLLAPNSQQQSCA